MNLYVLTQNNLGYVLMLHDLSISCEEFKKICDELAKEFGDDIYIIHEKLIECGFKDADIQCHYNVGGTNRFTIS